MGAALSTAVSGGEQIMILGSRSSPDTSALWHAVQRRYRPFAISVIVDPRDRDRFAAHMPWVASMTAIEDKATAYVCRDFVCSQPTTSVEALP